MHRVRRFLRKAVAGWLALEAAVGIAVAVAFGLDGRYAELVVVLVLVAVFIALSWRLGHARARRGSP